MSNYYRLGGKWPYVSIRHGHIWRFKPRKVTGIVLNIPHCLCRYTVHLLHSAPRVWPLWSTLKGTFTVASGESQVAGGQKREEKSETRVFIFLALYYAVGRQWPYASTKGHNSWQAAISYSPSPDTFRISGVSFYTFATFLVGFPQESLPTSLKQSLYFSPSVPCLDPYWYGYKICTHENMQYIHI